jgi:hypothetical protein
LFDVKQKIEELTEDISNATSVWLRSLGE